jgi:hypothetical protein
VHWRSGWPQAVELLHCKGKALSSNPSPTKKKKEYILYDSIWITFLKEAKTIYCFWKLSKRLHLMEAVTGKEPEGGFWDVTIIVFLI